MDPGTVPDFLQQHGQLSIVEAMFLARVHPVVGVYRVKGGQWKMGSAHVINFFRDITKSFGIIPCLPTSLPMVVLRQRGQQINDYKDFTVCLP
jgi:hypothetical protein